MSDVLNSTGSGAGSEAGAGGSETVTGPVMELPRYRCHKEVWALKIANVLPARGADGGVAVGAVIFPADERYAPITVPMQFVVKHRPEIGGYYVVYADGYTSFSPAAAFEEGYTRL